MPAALLLVDSRFRGSDARGGGNDCAGGPGVFAKPGRNLLDADLVPLGMRIAVRILVLSGMYIPHSKTLSASEAVRSLKRYPGAATGRRVLAAWSP